MKLISLSSSPSQSVYFLEADLHEEYVCQKLVGWLLV